MKSFSPMCENLFIFCQVEKNGQIEIRVSGKIGNVDINPDNFGIREIISILENVDDLLYIMATKKIDH